MKVSIEKKPEKWWMRLCIIHFAVVAFLGVILRSKILFPIPFIDYNRLLDAHHHFAFAAWATLALMVLMVSEILPEISGGHRLYKFIYATVAALAWIQLIAFPFLGNNYLADAFSAIFIFFTWAFCIKFISDLLKANVSSIVIWLSFTSLISLAVSSAGIFSLAYLFGVKSLNPYLYRDSLYTYLHFQYNGFFTFGVLAIFFNKLEKLLSLEALRRVKRFVVFFCISLLPSLFLSFLWQAPPLVFWVIAACGSLLLFFALISLVLCLRPIIQALSGFPIVSKRLITLALLALTLKLLLQGFTISPLIGHAVFGDRPIIIAFLHLVFLTFVTVFLLAWFVNLGVLNFRSHLVQIALYSLTGFIILNEVILTGQGLGAMLMLSSGYFPWLLWLTSLGLFISAVLVVMAMLKKPHSLT